MAAYASGVTEGLKDPASLTCLQVTAAYFACLRVAGLSLGLVNQVPDEVRCTTCISMQSSFTA